MTDLIFPEDPIVGQWFTATNDAVYEWNGVTWITIGSRNQGNYFLPTASTSVLGGVKVDGTTITVNGSGVISTGTSSDPSRLVNGSYNVSLNSDGTITFPTNTIKNTGSVAIETSATATSDVAVDAADTNGSTSRLFVLDSVYPTLGVDIAVNTSVTVGWGSNITATVTGIAHDIGYGRWIFTVDQNVLSGYSHNSTVTFNAGQKIWSFGTDGTLKVPGTVWLQASDNGSIVFSNNGTDDYGSIKVDGGHNMVTSASSNYYVKRAGQDRLGITDNDTTLMAGRNLILKSNKNSTEKVWTLGSDGSITFPDNTTQSTAWTGTVAYSPATPSDWAGTPPITIQEAIDRLAAAVKALNGSGA